MRVMAKPECRSVDEYIASQPEGARGALERVTAFRNELATYEVRKGTIRFPLSERAPVKLIGRIAKLRAKEISGRARAKAAISTKR